MKNQFTLEINKPCSENFNNFKPTSSGGFCDSCNTNVIDFTGMSSEEITNYFKKNSAKNTCGQFNYHQLKTYTKTPFIKRKLSIVNILSLAVISFFSFNTTAQAQENTNNSEKKWIKIKKQEANISVNGTVSDESGPLPGVSILLEGSKIGVETDFDGKFEFPKKLKKGDILIFSFVGMDSQKVVVNNKDSASKVTMKVDMKMNSCVLLGKVAVKKLYKSK